MLRRLHLCSGRQLQRLGALAACWAACALAGPAGAAGIWPKGDVDGALTLLGQRGPDYLGANTYGQSWRPGFYLRWGRLAVSSGGGWASVRDDDLRGLGLDVRRTESLRISLGLRFDSGRDEASAPALKGMGDVRRTVRARLGANWQFAPKWQLRAGWTVDAFGRGGGNLGDLRVQHDQPLTPRTKLSASVGLSLAGDRYLQTYYGVTPEQSARTGYRMYEPHMSLRDVNAAASLRFDLADDWVALVGLGFTRVLGDAAHSPLTQRTTAWSLSAGVGWRF